MAKAQPSSKNKDEQALGAAKPKTANAKPKAAKAAKEEASEAKKQPAKTPRAPKEPKAKTSKATSKATRSTKHQPTDDEIAQRAYELFLARGGRHGYHMEDWFKAEKELREGKG